MNENESVWHPYENGDTIGQIGFDGGMILRDEEFGDLEEIEDADARITLERGSRGLDTRRVTVNLYGWMQGFRDYATEADAQTDFDDLKNALPTVAALIPDEDDKNITAMVARLNAALKDLQSRFDLRED